MGRNPEMDAIRMAKTNQRILAGAYRAFAERTIEGNTMNDVAKEAGLGVASVYRYYPTKPDLVLGVSTWAWEKFYKEYVDRVSGKEIENRTVAEDFENYLDSFLYLYREHSDMLRFNQNFNLYMRSGEISADRMNPYTEMIRAQARRFSITYQKGKEDGTLRTDMPEEEMFSATMHLMLAVVTRYAVGLAYMEGTDIEKELNLQKRMLMREFVVEN